MTEVNKKMNRKLVTKRKRNNQCYACDRYFLTQVKLLTKST